MIKVFFEEENEKKSYKTSRNLVIVFDEMITPIKISNLVQKI